MDKHLGGCTFSVHCSFKNAKDNVVIVLLMCLRHPGWCTTTDVSLVTVWAHHEYSCAGRGPERTSLWQQYEERKRLLGSPSCETTTTVMEILDGFFLVITELTQEEGGNCLSPAEVWHIFHIKTDAYLLSCTETANTAFHSSEEHLCKIPQMSGTEDAKHLCDKWFEEYCKYRTTAVKRFKLAFPTETLALALVRVLLSDSQKLSPH